MNDVTRSNYTFMANFLRTQDNSKFNTKRYESQYLEILIFCSYLGHFQVESFNQGSFSYLYRDTLNQISLLNTLHNKT